MGGTTKFTVSTKEQGARLDHWLTRKLSKISRAQIKTLIDGGRASVNRRRVLIAGWELKSGDTVEVRIPDVRAPVNGSTKKNNRKVSRPADDFHAGSDRYLKILFEDRDLIVVDKPAGVLAEGKEGSPHDQLLAMIRGYLKRKFKESRGSYVKMLHRLDTETSGAIVAAKSKVGEQLEAAFSDHKIDRVYDAIVCGRIEKEQGKINLPLEKGDFGDGHKVQVSKDGKRAITEYRVKERYINATWLEVRVATGRTHQIRVHLAHIGHPVIGDKRYGTRDIPFHRQALHARQLGFRHPRTQNKMEFQAKMPNDLNVLIDRLRGA